MVIWQQTKCLLYYYVGIKIYQNKRDSPRGTQ